MAQINFKVRDEFNKQIIKVAEDLGVKKSDYIKSLIINDLRKVKK